LKLARDLKEIKPQRPYLIILTGNGKWERKRVLPPLCEKYDGSEKFLWFPEPPRVKKETGLKALNAIKHYLIQYGLERFLFLLDREHLKAKRGKAVKEQGQILNYLQRKLRAKLEESHELLPQRAFAIKGRIGSLSFNLSVVIFGATSKIEEEISELIKLKYGIEVEAKDSKIKWLLRRKRKRLEDLLAEASKKALEKAFPGLYAAP